MGSGQKLFLAACFLMATMATTGLADDAPPANPPREPPHESNYHVGVTYVALRPTVGAVFFSGERHFTGGLLMDINFLGTPWARAGLATGALYTSLADNSFFGGVSTDNRNYIFQVPANLKITFSPDPEKRMQLGVHGGANVIRSASGTIMVFGSDVFTRASSWDAHPNVGADIEFSLGTNVDFAVRPDITFLSQFNMFTTTVGLGLKF